jgi:hypothetical protein
LCLGHAKSSRMYNLYHLLDMIVTLNQSVFQLNSQESQHQSIEIMITHVTGFIAGGMSMD